MLLAPEPLLIALYELSHHAGKWRVHSPSSISSSHTSPPERDQQPCGAPYTPIGRGITQTFFQALSSPRRLPSLHPQHLSDQANCYSELHLPHGVSEQEECDVRRDRDAFWTRNVLESSEARRNNGNRRALSEAVFPGGSAGRWR